MSANTKIEWATKTWNPLRGCSKVSDGCRNCYAETLAKRFSGPGMPYEGTITDGRWNGQIRLVPEVLDQPLRWKRPRKIFVNSMSDLFHPNVPFDYIDQVFAVMALAPQHTFQILTKRPERMVEWFNRDADEWGMPLFQWRIKNWPLPNVWLGVSVENQKAADERIPLLLQTPAAVRFLSCEPLLGPVILNGQSYGLADGLQEGIDWLTGRTSQESTIFGGSALPWLDRDLYDFPQDSKEPRIHWVIAGGESGPGARPMHPDWAMSLRDQCQAAGVAYFFKQWGEWAPIHELRCNEPGIKGRPWFNFDPDTALCRIGKQAAGRMLDGREWNEFPAGMTHG